MSVFPDYAVRLHIASDPAHLPIVRAAVERMCSLMELEESAAADVVLAVDEALTNIIKHAYHGTHDRPIEISFRPLQAGADGRPIGSPPAKQESLGLEIRMRDWGEQTALEKIRSRDLADVRPGGLGVHIMKRCMDSVEYSHAADGGTVLTMVKLPTSNSRPLTPRHENVEPGSTGTRSRP